MAATGEICLFNINGLRARPHQLEAIVESTNRRIWPAGDKVHDDMFPLEEVAKLGYNVFYHGQKGHYGVALLTKETRRFPCVAAFPVTTKRRNGGLLWRKSLAAGQYHRDQRLLPCR